MQNDGGILRPKLISRDDALINLAKYSSIHGLIEINQTPMPVVSYDHEDLDEDTQDFLDEIRTEIRNTMHIRSESFLGDIEKHIPAKEPAWWFQDFGYRSAACYQKNICR